jgi:hypothetical protein
MNLFRPTMFALALACAASAAAETRLSMQQQLEVFQRHAGDPVSHVLAFHGIENWEPLSADAIALWASPHRVYLVRVDRPCNGLGWVHGIRVTHYHPMIEARFDSIEFGANSCRIQEIRPVDYAAVRRELYASRAP